MKLKSFKYFFGFLIIILFTQLKSEEKIDIWKNKNTEKEVSTNEEIKPEKSLQKKIKIKTNNINDQKIKIEKNLINSEEEDKVFGLMLILKF